LKEHQSKISPAGSIYPTLPHFNTLEGIYLIQNDSPKGNAIGSVSSGWPGRLVLLVAIAAVHRPRAIGLEGNLTRLSALCAGGVVHLSWAAVVAASVSASVSLHLFHLPLGIDSMNRSYYKTSHQNSIEATLMQLLTERQAI
jgi:hypothetical protein